MLVFITSIRHPWNCHSFYRVGELARLSLESVCGQLDNRFEVVVVCNRIPPNVFPNKVHFVEVDFPPPSPHKLPDTGLEAIWLDRGTKYAVGIEYARRFSPSHIMFFDVDDFVSNRLSKHVNENDEGESWIMERGLKIRYGGQHAFLVSDFFRYCGTSAIHPISTLSVPKEISIDSDQEFILKNINQNLLDNVLSGHRLVPWYYENILKTSMRTLPFDGAIWVLGTGENHSGQTCPDGKIEIDEAIRGEFMMPAEWPEIKKTD